MGLDLNNVEAQGGMALFGKSVAELRRLMEELGEKPYRGTQVAEALYKNRVERVEEISTLPSAIREKLTAAGWVVGQPVLAQTAVSVDGTERYLVRLADGETVETVWMPEGDLPEEAEIAGVRTGAKAGPPAARKDGTFGVGKDDIFQGRFKRATICVSSQVGCAVNCQFCLTAKLGIKRNLTAGEIAGQVAAVLTRHDAVVGSGRGQGSPDRINLVFMGMGEPFLNYDAFMDAVRILVGEMKIPASRMTVSTSGIEPAIRRFAEEPVRPNLALSLNASNDVVRERIMPITRKWDIAALLAAVNTIPFSKREFVTFEYVLLGGVNDQPEHAREVLALLKGMQAKVNLIVWNPGPGIEYHQPTPADVAVFHRMLVDGGIPTFTRKPRGRDIYAACGQLKRTVEAEPGVAAGLVTIGATR
jgi:23S rRNA (adenine2503-C2)-methyltransferase